MPTQWFLRDIASDQTIGTDTTKQVLASRGAASATTTITTVTGAVTPPTTATQIGTTKISWLSPPLKGVTISGSVTINLRAAESANSGNATVEAQVFRVTGGNTIGATIVAVPPGTIPTEVALAGSSINYSVTPTSTTLS